MALQRDGAGLGHAGQARIYEHMLVVEPHIEHFANHANAHAVPLSHGRVGVHLRRASGAHFGGHRGVGSIAIDLARTAWPGPQVDLALGVAAQVNAAIALLDLDHLVGGVGVLDDVSILPDVRTVHLALMLRRPLPIELHLEVAVAFVGPEIAAFAVEMDLVSANRPMLASGGVALGVAFMPSSKAQAVEDRPQSLVGEVADHFGRERGHGGGKFGELEVLEPDLRAFALKANEALARRGVLAARDLGSVDRKLDDALVASHLVMVPLAGALGHARAR